MGQGVRAPLIQNKEIQIIHVQGDGDLKGDRDMDMDKTPLIALFLYPMGGILYTGEGQKYEI